MGNSNEYEVIIIGAGIAGASVAYFLTQRGITDILILEREGEPGYHSSGRSAAVLVEFDPIPSVLGLKLLAADFLRNPPEGFSENPLLTPSGILVTFKGPMWDMVQQMIPIIEKEGVAIELLTPDEVVRKIPVLSAKDQDGGVFLPEDGHIDVHELLWGYIGHAKRAGAELCCNAEVTGISVETGRCVGVETPEGKIKARHVVNAAGAWAGLIGQLAGAAPIKLTPKRRTIITFASPDDVDVSKWPLVTNFASPLYFAPESDGLLASPMDEDPMEPCDAKPDDLVVAQTIERLSNFAPSLVPKSIRRKWAGLRTFAPDQGFVVGEDPLIKGFHWLAGHGGAGIETSPIVGKIAAELIIDGKTDLVDTKIITPTRFIKKRDT